MAGLPRSKARRAAVQALYQSQVNGEKLGQDALDFVTAEYANSIDKKYFASLIKGVEAEQAKIDDALSAALDRDLKTVDPVESSILRMATYELMFLIEVPYRVVLNEAVELAKSFGGEQGHKYVNGVLDKVGEKVRQAEYASVKSSRK